MEPTTPAQKGPMSAIIIVVAILVLGGGYFIFNRLPKTLTAEDVSWELVAASAAGSPTTTNVTLKVRGKTYDVGTYPGECAQIAENQLQTNEVSGVVCVFAGFDEIGLFKDHGAYVVKQGEIIPPSEDEEGFRGNYDDLFTL